MAERKLGAPGPMEGEGSWATEAEVLELLVALRAARITLAERTKEGVTKRDRESKHTTGCIAADADVSVFETTESV